VVRTQEELIHVLTDGDPEAHASGYRIWREKFNARDDGHAAERVVSRILDQGFIDRES
jgi:CDP-glycerol glycerophosphotransferase